jgi:hypothetical protein
MRAVRYNGTLLYGTASHPQEAGIEVRDLHSRWFELGALGIGKNSPKSDDQVMFV